MYCNWLVPGREKGSEMNATSREHPFRDNPEGVMVRDVVIARAVEDLEPGTALDLGCGIGTHAFMLARRGWTVTGIDRSAHAIDIANNNAAREQLPARFVTADITEWEPVQEYDLVISTYALPGGADSHKVMHTATRALKPGGTLIAVEWDHSMAERWGYGPDAFPSPSDLASMVPGLMIVNAESRVVSDILKDDPAHEENDATIAYLRARKPNNERHGNESD